MVYITCGYTTGLCPMYSDPYCSPASASSCLAVLDIPLWHPWLPVGLDIESGDLGFNRKSSNHIVIALLITKNPFKVERCIKRIRLRKLKKKLKELPEIKFNKSNDHIRVYRIISYRNYDMWNTMYRNQ